jgi:diaminopimelate epimerase
MTFPWLKGHGTENDFVLLPDHEGTIHGELDEAFVAAICHRRRGIGADGVMRVVRAAAIGEESAGEWFMDYRNADGSVSEMCGNGIRVFALHLVQEGLIDPAKPLVIGTRGGDKTISFDGDRISVDMGPYAFGESSKVEVDGRNWESLHVSTGNPHAVAFVESLDDAGTLITEPDYDHRVYPAGVNIEFVDILGAHHVAMRVHERGSGETQSCGTGACAVAAATASVQGDTLPATYRVDVPGGTLHVRVTADTRVILTGPAEIVARGTMDWIA